MSREVVTVKVDSFGVSGSYSTFTAYLPIPLRNVVKAELLMASIHPETPKTMCHVYVEELVSNFLTRAAPAYTVGLSSNVSNVGVATQILNKGPIERAFATIPTSNVVAGTTDNRVVWTVGNDFPTDVEYINPIRQLKTLTITFYDGKTGNLQNMDEISYFIFRFECSKDDIRMY